jgi:hypothetical protein
VYRRGLERAGGGDALGRGLDPLKGPGFLRVCPGRRAQVLGPDAPLGEQGALVSAGLDRGRREVKGAHLGAALDGDGQSPVD